jgi:CheY-like chemotaxis protein
VSCVLLVDDEPGVLFTLSELLHERGHKVVTARSGVEALTWPIPPLPSRRTT